MRSATISSTYSGDPKRTAPPKRGRRRCELNFQAAALRLRRAKASMPLQARTMPGRPAPTIGPGTGTVVGEPAATLPVPPLQAVVGQKRMSPAKNTGAPPLAPTPALDEKPVKPVMSKAKVDTAQPPPLPPGLHPGPSIVFVKLPNGEAPLAPPTANKPTGLYRFRFVIDPLSRLNASG
jgi:hypothetical protein